MYKIWEYGNNIGMLLKSIIIDLTLKVWGMQFAWSNKLLAFGR